MNMDKFYKSMAVQLVEEGYIVTNEYGYARLTEKGKKRAAQRLDKLPAGDEVLLNLAFCEGHEISVSVT